jgi:hypothetical protein
MAEKKAVRTAEWKEMRRGELKADVKAAPMVEKWADKMAV